MKENVKILLLRLHISSNGHMVSSQRGYKMRSRVKVLKQEEEG